MHNTSPVTAIKYRCNCTKIVWSCYIGSDFWFKDDFWEASLLSFQRSFSKTYYVEEDLAGKYSMSQQLCSQQHPFLMGVFECDIAHHWSVAVLCMLYKIRCNLMHALYGAIPVLCLPVQVTCGALVAHWNAGVSPHCRTSQYCYILFLSLCFCETILLIFYSMV